MTKQLNLKLVLIILVSMMGMNAYSYDACIDGIYYNFNGDNAIVTHQHPTNSSNDYKGAVVIPSSVHYNSKDYSVTSIDEDAFNMCSGLTSITIPSSVTSIDENAFSGCSSLTTITIPSSVTSIGDYAFSGCTGLTAITIPNSVQTLGNNIVSGCIGLNSINVDAGNSIYDSRGNCNAIILTATNTLIAGCKSTVIPNTVTSIGFEAFYFCSSLTTITIPNSVLTIGNNAFHGCSGLTSVKLYAETPAPLLAGIFPTAQPMTLYVPQGSKAAYQSASGWRNFRTIIEYDPSFTLTANDVEMEYGDAVPAFTYTTEGETFRGTPQFTCDATSASPVGTYPIVVGRGTIDNDHGTYVNGTLTIEKAPLTITAKSYSIKQGDALPTFEIEYSGFKNDESLSVLTTKSSITCNATSESEPGTYDIIVSGAAAQNYSFTYVKGTLTITQANPVTVTAKSYTRLYGEANPAFEYTSSGAALSGIPSITCEATATSPVGDYPIVIAKGTVTNYNDTYVNGKLTIEKAPLTITAKSYSIKQGETLPTFEIEYSGFKNSETSSVLTTKPTITCTATSASAPGTYDIIVSGADAANYSFTYVKGTLTVTQADPVTVTAKSYSRQYGEANPAFEYTSSGAALSGTPSITCEATATSPVGEYPIVIAKGTVTNYNDTYVNGKLTVTKAPLTITAKNYAIKQGDALPTFEVEYSGFKNSETSSVLATQPTITCTATSASEPGTYDIVVSGADATNYDITYVKGTLTITQANPVTVTAKSYTRLYGEANPAFEYTSSGAALSGTPSITCEATATSPVGEYPIVITKGTVTNYNDTYVNGKLTIEKAPLTITAKNYAIKQGDAMPTFEIEYSGFKNSETSSVLATQPTITCNATSASEPGTYDIVVSGADATNYDITYVKGTLTITQADPVTVTAKSYARQYGEANPAFEYTSSGAALSGIPTITCEATATSPVGEYPIVIAKGTVTNYNDTYVNGKLTVTKAPLTITAKNYAIKQGDALPTFEVEYSGFKNSETSSVLATQPTITCTATSASEPGTYDIVVSGADATNYDITYVKGTLTITQANPVTVTAKSYTRLYGEANPAFEYTSSGAALSGTPSITCEATATSPVGEYPIVITKGTVTNYNDTYVNGKLTITKAPLTITAKSYSIKQGDALPTFEIEYSGFKNDESLSVLTTKSSITCSATSESEPGTYDIIVSGAAAQNYSFTYVKGTLTITQANPVTVTAKSYSRQYGEANPAFEYTSSGAALSGTPSITCEATATSPVGEYDIVVSKGSVTNYNDTYVNGKLTVTKAPLTITAKNYAIKQGDALPTFEIEYSGFKNSETSSVLTTKPTITCTATSASEPGTYDIIVSGATAANYSITYVKGTLTITQADPVTVAAKSYTRPYGEANPAFEYISSGAALSGTPSITCEATATSPVGEYPIVIAKGTVTNYNDTYVNGKLTIEKAPLTITAKSYSIKQGDALPTFEAEYSGFKNSETSSVLATQPTITCNATSESEPGTYDIIVSGAAAQNYSFTYVKGTLTITQANPVTVTAKSYSRQYGEANPAFEYTSSGAALSGIPSITCEATATSPVGEYDIVVSKGSVTNYNDTYVNGKLTVTKAPLTITAKNYAIKQGDSLPTFEVEYSGFKNNEASSVLATQPTITCNATSASEPGTYDIIVSGADAANYGITYVKGTLTITQADEVVVAANSYIRLYGDANPTFGYFSFGTTLGGEPDITCEATATSPVGEYDIVPSKGTITNYNVTYVNGKLIIGKTPLTITAKSYIIKQGDAMPTFEAEYSGFKNDETSQVLAKQPAITTTATSASEPGTYDIVVSGADATNYDITYVKGTLTITQADPVTVTAKSYTRLYGEANPAFEYTSSGAALSGTPSITCAATTTSPVGDYPIVIAKGTVTNYNDTYVNGKLTIEKAPLTITAKSYSIKQGETLPTFEIEYSGFKNSETSSVLTTKPTITCTATSASEPGTYDIIVSGAAAANYDITYVKGTLTITDADKIVIAANSYCRLYGDANPTFGYVAFGTTLSGKPDITCEATATSPVGEYDIVASKGTVTNYNDTYVNGKLIIIEAPLTITAKNYTIKQGETLPTFEATYEGFKNSETSQVLTTQPTITTTATSASEPGTYDIVVSGAAATNYDITYVKGTLTIIQADPVTITAKSYTIHYGDELPTFEFTSEGATLKGTPAITCEATKTSAVGTYPIVIKKGSVTNFNTAFVNGKLTISKAPLTITAKSYTIKQGETLPTFEATYEGFKNSQTSSVLTTQPSISCSATSASAPGTYDIVVSGAAATNYDIIYVKGTLTITQADAVTVVAKSYSRQYGEANPSFDYTSSGAALSGTPSITCAATVTSPVGEYDIVANKGTITNYNVTYVNGKLTVTKAPLTITAKNFVIKQGDALPTFEIEYSGFKNGETSSVLATQPTITCSASSSSAPGTYDIVVSGADAANYSITYVKGTLTITQADKVVVAAYSFVRLYGGANPTFGYFSFGTTLSGEPDITCEAIATSPVGEYDIVPSKGTITNNNVTYVNGKLAIIEAPLTITAKNYTIKQGETLPTFEATYEGFKNSETSQVLAKQPAITTTATSASAPGTYDIVVSGADATNYDITYVKGTLTITQADPVTITAKSYTIHYGDELPTFEFASEGATLKGTPAISCEATKTSAVGTYPIGITKGSVTNYNTTFVNGTLTITKAPLNITAKSYTIKQGEALPTFEATYEGFKNNETSQVLTKQPVITTTATSTSAPGTYDIVVSGATAANYDIIYVKGTLTITQADLVTVIAKSYSRQYGEANPAFEYTSSGAALIGTPNITCAATATSPVGEYDIVANKGTVTNHNLALVNGKLTVTKAPLTITAKNYAIKQGEALPTFEIEYSGFKNGETSSVLATQPTITCSASSSSAPGTYDIVVSGADAANYSITYVKGTLTITQADEVVVAAYSFVRLYGDANPPFGYFTFGAALSGEPSITCEATATSPVGEYDIVPSKGTITNYNVTYVNGELMILQAPLTITAKSYTIKQGEAMPTFEVEYSGFKNDETKAVLATQPTISCSATSASAPGTYDIVVSGADATNYDITYVKGTLTITQADPVTITAKSYTIQYGDELPIFEFTSEGATLEGKPVVTCEATTTSAVGTYPIVITKGSVTNYNTTFVSGTLTIKKAPLTITAKSCTIKQGEALPTFEATYEGFKNNETSQVLTKQPAITTTATSSNEPGEYDITISGAEAQNYDISYVAGKLTITASDGIKEISFEHPVSVFNLSGHKVRSNVTSLEGLPKGVYIINGKKVAIK